MIDGHESDDAPSEGPENVQSHRPYRVRVRMLDGSERLLDLRNAECWTGHPDDSSFEEMSYTPRLYRSPGGRWVKATEWSGMIDLEFDIPPTDDYKEITAEAAGRWFLEHNGDYDSADLPAEIEAALAGLDIDADAPGTPPTVNKTSPPAPGHLGPIMDPHRREGSRSPVSEIIQRFKDLDIDRQAAFHTVADFSFGSDDAIAAASCARVAEAGP